MTASSLERQTLLKSEMEVITEKVAADYNVLPSELRGTYRFSHFTEPRRVIWKALNDKGHSLPAIGRFFGRHHTTILEGINKLEESACNS